MNTQSHALDSLKNSPYILSVEELSLTSELLEKLNSSSDEKHVSEATTNIETLAYFRFTYLSQNHKVVGFLIQPDRGDRSPCIIYNRGGSGNFNKIEPERVFTDKYSKYAKWGYVTILTQYSGNDGGEGTDELGGTEIHDVLALRDILSTYIFADISRIGMYGTSRGGTMTYLALSKVSWIRAAAVKSGMADRFRSFELRPEMRDRASNFFDVGNEQELIKRSAVHWAERFSKTTPLLLIHGTADRTVSPLDSMNLGELLFENKVPFRLVLLEGGDHSLTNYKDEENYMVRNWFDKYVRDLSPLPTLEPLNQ
jgi:dipeptidyl aminopeptidase/acylaminoacyl peptidase